MFAWTGILMVLYLTTGTSNLAMAFPTANLQSEQGPREQSSSPTPDDQAFREFQNILATNSRRFMSDLVRSFLSPEDIRASFERAPVTYSTPTVDQTLEAPNLATRVVPPYARPTRSADDDASRADIEGKAGSSSSSTSSPFPYLPGYPSTSPGSSSTSSGSNSNPLYAGYNPGSAGSGQGDATLIIGGFNALLVPMPGVNANNMGSALQNGQQLGQFTPGNPFTASRSAI